MSGRVSTRSSEALSSFPATLLDPRCHIFRVQIARRVESIWSGTVCLLFARSAPFPIYITLANRRLIYRIECNPFGGEICVFYREPMSATKAVARYLFAALSFGSFLLRRSMRLTTAPGCRQPPCKLEKSWLLMIERQASVPPGHVMTLLVDTFCSYNSAGQQTLRSTLS